jgi:hypothetical protein
MNRGFGTLIKHVMSVAIQTVMVLASDKWTISWSKLG